MTVTPVANIPSVRRNAAAGSCPGSPAISSLLRVGSVLGEGLAEPDGREPAVDRQIELERRRLGDAALAPSPSSRDTANG